MTELFCRIFLGAFLFFYSTLFFVLLGRGIRGALEGRHNRTRIVRPPEPFRTLVLSSQPQRD